MKIDNKVEFVKQHYPDIGKVDPYQDRKVIDDIKAQLIKFGLYKAGAKHLYNESAIINVVLRAQGKKTYNRRVSQRGHT